MTKEYSKLTAKQFKDFINKLSEVQRQQYEFEALLGELQQRSLTN